MTPLLDYLTQIRQAIDAFTGVQVERYQEQFLTDTRANLRIRLRLPDNSFLEISEALLVEEGEIIWLSYRYHWQDPIGCLILRYDDAPHHKEVETYPEHKHETETTVASQRPSLLDVLNEIHRLLSKR